MAGPVVATMKVRLKREMSYSKSSWRNIIKPTTRDFDTGIELNNTIIPYPHIKPATQSDGFLHALAHTFITSYPYDIRDDRNLTVFKLNLPNWSLQRTAVDTYTTLSTLHHNPTL